METYLKTLFIWEPLPQVDAQSPFGLGPGFKSMHLRSLIPWSACGSSVTLRTLRHTLNLIVLRTKKNLTFKKWNCP